MSNMFRASPWVTYDPTPDPHHPHSAPVMDDDVDMDAPQISTLREEETPPPQRKSAAASRKGKGAAKPKPAETWARQQRNDAASEEDFDEPEEEEDQLIDDDDDDDAAPPKPTPAPAPSSARAAEAAQKLTKPATGKRKSRKTEKGAEKEKELKEKKPRKSKVSQQQNMGAPNLAPTMLWFEVRPTESHEDPGNADGNVTHVGEPEPSVSKPGRKKGASPKKAAAIKAPKVKVAPKLKLPVVAPQVDDTALSEAGCTATVPSSPATQHLDMSPEPDADDAVASGQPPIEEAGLENVPIPVYPLPSKPFPVQPPVKINSGFAPVLPLDKSGKKVRHWRTANREIRGIAGGRWFSHTWVGEKESEFATALALRAGAGVGVEGDKANIALPKLPVTSISAPLTGRGGKRGGKAGSVASRTVSAAPSRSGSMGPEVLAPGGIPITVTSKPHVPTKMRVLQLAPEAEAEADAVGGSQSPAPEPEPEPEAEEAESADVEMAPLPAES